MRDETFGKGVRGSMSSARTPLPSRAKKPAKAEAVENANHANSATNKTSTTCSAKVSPPTARTRYIS